MISIYSEHKAVITTFRPVRSIIVYGQEKEERIINSSPVRLIIGGRPSCYDRQDCL